MNQPEAIDLVQRIANLALELKQAYGKRLADKNSNNPYIVAARAKMEAYIEITNIIKEMNKL